MQSEIHSMLISTVMRSNFRALIAICKCNEYSVARSVVCVEACWSKKAHSGGADTNETIADRSNSINIQSKLFIYLKIYIRRLIRSSSVPWHFLGNVALVCAVRKRRKSERIAFLWTPRRAFFECRSLWAKWIVRLAVKLRRNLCSLRACNKFPLR